MGSLDHLPLQHIDPYTPEELYVLQGKEGHYFYRLMQATTPASVPPDEREALRLVLYYAERLQTKIAVRFAMAGNGAYIPTDDEETEEMS